MINKETEEVYNSDKYVQAGPAAEKLDGFLP